MKTQKAVLKNWNIIWLNKHNYMLGGQIYNDKTKRFKDGQYIYTSNLVKINFKTNKAETLNTIYTLED